MQTSRILSLAAVAALSISLASCAGSSETAPEASAPAESGTFPVTIEHVYGETVIEEKPERVASVAWGNGEVPIALGIVPVGMAKTTWGDDDKDGILPWTEERLEELGGETPVLFDETDGIDFEAVADTQPDVILASYSGLTQEDYDTLSKIAPVVAYPEVPWATSYQDMIRMNSAALGLATEGDELISELESTVQASLDKHPALADTAAIFSFVDTTDLSTVGYYTAADTRPGFLHELGLPLPALIEESKGSTEFYLQVSAEEAQKFDDVDLFVTYGDPKGDLVAQLQADPLMSKIPAIAAGSVAILENDSPLAASANPSPLSIGWGIDDYFDLLESAIVTP